MKGRLTFFALFLFVITSMSFAQITTVRQTDVGTSWLPGDTRTGGSSSFDVGPSTPPLGTGSLHMTTTDAVIGGNSKAKVQLMNYSYIGTKLSDITSMSYYAYRSLASTNPIAQTISINIEIDYVGDGSSYATIVFEPVYQVGGVGAIHTNEWQLWDAFKNGNAIWWSNKSFPGYTAWNINTTWNQIKAANPNAKIKYGIGLNCGSGWAGQFFGAADGLTIGANGVNTTYDFEPTPPPIQNNLICIINQINLIYPTGDKNTDKKIDDLLKHFNKSIESDLWLSDGNYLDPKHGNKVFDELKDVVKKLQELIKDKKSAIDDETLLGYINEIVDNTKALAQKAIDDAIAACDGDKNCQKEINKANEELAKAADELAKGKDDKYDNAIDHYKKAWEHAQKALKKSDAIAEENSLNKDEASLDNSSSIPEKFELGQNYPNPFNPSTNINFALPANEFVTIKIYDVLGKEVANLVNSNMNAGYHTVNWDASNVPSGIYIYRIQAGSFQSVKKMILMK